MEPEVSIIIPVYNAEEYIEETLQSIFNQTYKNYEIIVVDDGSTDNSPNIIKNYNDKVHYVHQENSGGPSTPRNNGIQRAKGKYIALFDSDDIMFEHKLKNDVDILENHPDVSLVFSNFILLESHGPRDHSWFDKDNVKAILDSIPKINIGPNQYKLQKNIYNEVLHNNFIGTSTVMFRKKDFLDVGFFDETLIGIEDRDMWLRFCKSGKRFAYTLDVHSYYRYRVGSISRKLGNLISRIDFYSRLLPNENSTKNRKLIRDRLGDLYLQYALILRNDRSFAKSIVNNIKSFHYFLLPGKSKSLTAILKTMILIFIPSLSDSIQNK